MDSFSTFHAINIVPMYSAKCCLNNSQNNKIDIVYSFFLSYG